MNHPSQIPTVEATLAVQKLIENFNAVYVDLLLTAARFKDPAIPALMGISMQTLEEYSKISKFDLISAAKLGIPLAVARFTDPSVVQELFKTGCSQSKVLAELSKSLPMEPITKPGRGVK